MQICIVFTYFQLALAHIDKNGIHKRKKNTTMNPSLADLVGNLVA
jgi:hypothetical protein